MKNKIILFLVLCFCINFAGIAQSTVHESVKFQSKKLGKEVSYSIYLPDGLCHFRPPLSGTLPVTRLYR